MTKMTEAEFSKYFDENFRYKLEDLEQKRRKYAPIRKFFSYFSLLLFVLLVIVWFVNASKSITETIMGVIVVLLIVSFFVMGAIDSSFRKPLKSKVISRVISLYGNLYLTSNKNIITLKDILNLGLFPRATNKIDDDFIVGNYNKTNLIINECRLQHQVRTGKHTYTVTDFSGLLVKFVKIKKFSGVTVVGASGETSQKRGLQKVELESVDFMKGRKVYSTDQIEARYILTPTFMERLDNLGKYFTDKVLPNAEDKKELSLIDDNSSVSAAFVDGDIYLFIPSDIDFFEVSIDRSLLDYSQYYTIYMQINSILEIIEYFKLDQQLGL